MRSKRQTQEDENAAGAGGVQVTLRGRATHLCRGLFVEIPCSTPILEVFHIFLNSSFFWRRLFFLVAAVWWSRRDFG